MRINQIVPVSSFIMKIRLGGWQTLEEIPAFISKLITISCAGKTAESVAQWKQSPKYLGLFSNNCLS